MNEHDQATFDRITKSVDELKFLDKVTFDSVTMALLVEGTTISREMKNDIFLKLFNVMRYAALSEACITILKKNENDLLPKGKLRIATLGVKITELFEKERTEVFNIIEAHKDIIFNDRA